ncbi:MAG: hypothetical protein ACYC3I_16985 [Gemmataceae bacterium]
MAPETLRTFSVRLPAGLLIEAHRFAEEKNLDLTNAIRELTSLGLEAAVHPDALSPADRKEIKKWEKVLEGILRRGQSPLEPFIEQEHPDWRIVAAVLARLDLERIFQEFKGRHGVESFLERMWKKLKAEAQPFVRQRMEALDELEKRFLARKQLDYRGSTYECEENPVVSWLLSDELMGKMNDPEAEAEAKAVRELITARYLVARNPQTPWDLEWYE